MSAAEPTLPAVVIEPDAAPADAAVIWLHGLGADGHDFEPVVPQLGLPAGAAVRFVFPHAPQRPVTVNGGLAMRAWYDIYDMELSREDEAGTRDAERHVRALIAAQQERGVAPGRIVLAGFSQGGAVALHAGLTYPEPLAGILALSTYLALPEQLAADRHPDDEPGPVFMAHGTEDSIVPFELAEAAHRQLLEWGIVVRFHRYPMAHAVCAEEVAAIRDWLAQILVPLGAAY